MASYPKPHFFANLLPLMDAAAFDALCHDIQSRGLVEPIVLFGGKVLDGRNRLKACRKVGVKPTYKDFKGRDPLGHVLSLNIARRHLTESQRAILALDILPSFEAEAKARQRRGVKAKVPQGRGQARDYAARLFKVSPRYVQDAKKIATRAPDLKPYVKDAVLTIPEAKMLLSLTKGDRARLMAKLQKNPKLKLSLEIQEIRKRRILKGATALTNVSGKFDILLCDPPWEVEPSSTDRSIQLHYPTMTIEAIKAMPVKKLSADDSVLFLWTIASHLKNALEVMEAWGFAYVSHICWVKGPQFGLGHWVRSRHELLLIGRRGKFPTPIRIPGSVLDTYSPKRVRQHSRKPDEVYDLIEGMWPNMKMRRLELFARGNGRSGWHQWGAEAKRLKAMPIASLPLR